MTSKNPTKAVLKAAAQAAGLKSPQDLDDLARQLCGATYSFTELMATDANYQPTMRVDIDERFAQLAAAFNKAAELMDQARRAWTPAYSPEHVAVLQRFKLKEA